MSVSYSTAGGVKAPRVRKPKVIQNTAERAEKIRLAQMPAYRRASRDYPEEFIIDELVGAKDPKALPIHDLRFVDVTVEKGHSPSTKEGYTYAVRLYIGSGMMTGQYRFSPTHVFRLDHKPRKWVNHLKEGVIDPPEDGKNLIWFVGSKARSERMNSIIAKAKVRLAASMGWPNWYRY